MTTQWSVCLFHCMGAINVLCVVSEDLSWDIPRRFRWWKRWRSGLEKIGKKLLVDEVLSMSCDAHLL